MEKKQELSQSLLERSLFAGYAVAFSLLLMYLIRLFGSIQFPGMDGGVLINAAYQMLHGYKPYTEIVTPTPPAFLAGATFAFQLFGPSWRSLVLVTALFSSLTFLLNVTLLYKSGFGRLWSLLTSLLIQSTALVTISFWWYNRITAVAAALFISSLLLLHKDQDAPLAKFFFVLTTALLALTKINIAGLLLVLGFFIVWRWFRKHIVLFGIAAVGLPLLLLVLSHINPTDVLSNYLVGGGRLFSVSSWKNHMITNYAWEVRQTTLFALPALIGFLLTLHQLLSRRMKLRGEGPYLSIAATSIIIGIFGLGTNNDYNMVDGSLVIFGIVIASQKVWSGTTRDLRSKLANTFILSSMILLMANAIRVGYLRYNVRAAGEGAFYQKLPLTVLNKPKLLKDLSASPRLIGVLDQIEQVVTALKQERIDRNESIFFGPRIDFAYAIHQIKPPKGLPLWWEPFWSGETKEAKAMIERFKKKNFKAAIFLHRDYTFLPPQLIEYLNTNFEVYDSRDLTIHIAKNNPRLDSIKEELNNR